MSTDIKQKLQDLQDACTRAQAHSGQLEPMVVHDVAHAARLEIEKYEKVFADTRRLPHYLARIATAVEQAALKGWGNVFVESLLPDEPKPPEDL